MVYRLTVLTVLDTFWKRKEKNTYVGLSQS